MAAKPYLPVGLTEPPLQQARAAIAAGRHTTAGEVLRDALRPLIERDEVDQDREGPQTGRQATRHG